MQDTETGDTESESQVDEIRAVDIKATEKTAAEVQQQALEALMDKGYDFTVTVAKKRWLLRFYQTSILF